MRGPIEPGFMAFVAEGREGIGAVRGVSERAIVIYVENSGEYVVPRSAITAVHDQKVILDPKRLDAALLKAVGHAHDGEDPSVAG
ncbi:MAG: hypothetical protein ACKVP4_10240 [Hyphomicrobium sp.]